MRRDADHSTPDRRRFRRVGNGIVVTLVIGGSLLIGGWASRVDATARAKPTVATAPFAVPAGTALAETPPPWALPADARPYIAAAGLQVLSAEQLEVHYHAHLDVIANGNAVTVPAGIGFTIDQGKATGITTLHTHDTTGVIHIESASNVPFTLGQFFTEWGVALGPDALGGLKVDDKHALEVYVNGRRFRGDPATIRLKRHQEIALWYGPPGTHPDVPKSYRFPQGL